MSGYLVFQHKKVALVQHFNPKKLIIAGDFFHSRMNQELDLFKKWRNDLSYLPMHLVMGNHDILEKTSYSAHNIALHDKVLDAGAFLVSHDELKTPEKFYIHGHIHPAVSLSGRGRTSMRLSCFCADDKKMVLPSFGQFYRQS